MVLDVLGLFILFGLTVVLGYIGLFIFKKTRIPDVLWLLIFGLLVSYFQLIDTSIFFSVSTLFAAFALLIILFDAGLNMDFYKVVKVFSRTMLLGIVNFVLIMIAVGVIANLIFGLDLLVGLLLGAIVGSTSSEVVISLVSRIKLSNTAKTILNLESVLTDPLIIVVSFAIINIIVPTGVAFSPLHNILSAFSIGIILGLLIGLIWLIILDKLSGKPFDYILTLSILLLGYAFTEIAEGSGIIFALIFGLVLSNGKTFSRILRLPKKYTIDDMMKTFQSEISFFIKSFFFVYLGLIAVINHTYIIYGLIISLVIIVVRVVAVKISIYKMNLTDFDKKIMMTMAPRDLAAAIIAQLAVSYGVPGAEIFSSIIFVVIFTTVIYSALATMIFCRTGKVTKLKKNIIPATQKN